MAPRLLLVAKAESAPTGHQEEVLWPWHGSRKQCQVGLTNFGAVCFSGRRFVRRSKPLAAIQWHRPLPSHSDHSHHRDNV